MLECRDEEVDTMGLLEGLLSGLVKQASALTEAKYNDMPINELKSEWKSTFGDRSCYDQPYRSDSPDAILDRVYARRTGNATWLSKNKWKG